MLEEELHSLQQALEAKEQEMELVMEELSAVSEECQTQASTSSKIMGLKENRNKHRSKGLLWYFWPYFFATHLDLRSDESEDGEGELVTPVDRREEYLLFVGIVWRIILGLISLVLRLK